MFISLGKFLGKSKLRFGLGLRLTSTNFIWMSFILMFVCILQAMWYMLVIVFWILYAIIYGIGYIFKSIFKSAVKNNKYSQNINGTTPPTQNASNLSLLNNKCQPNQAENIKLQVDNDLRIIKDSFKIINNTRNPEVFFSRLDLLKKTYQHLITFEPYINTSRIIPSAGYNEILIKEQDYIYDFLVRYYADIYEKAESLKTETGKADAFKKYYSSLQPYFDRMNEHNINYINYKMQTTEVLKTGG